MGEVKLDNYEGLPWTETDSSNIKRVAWVKAPDGTLDDGVLYVEFHTGRAYSYAEVPERVHQALLEAESVGSFFAHTVKGEYECEAVQVIAR